MGYNLAEMRPWLHYKWKAGYLGLFFLYASVQVRHICSKDFCTHVEAIHWGPTQKVFFLFENWVERGQWARKWDGHICCPGGISLELGVLSSWNSAWLPADINAHLLSKRMKWLTASQGEERKTLRWVIWPSPVPYYQRWTKAYSEVSVHQFQNVSTLSHYLLHPVCSTDVYWVLKHVVGIGGYGIEGRVYGAFTWDEGASVH